MGEGYSHIWAIPRVFVILSSKIPKNICFFAIIISEIPCFFCFFFSQGPLEKPPIFSEGLLHKAPFWNRQWHIYTTLIYEYPHPGIRDTYENIQMEFNGYRDTWVSGFGEYSINMIFSGRFFPIFSDLDTGYYWGLTYQGLKG